MSVSSGFGRPTAQLQASNAKENIMPIPADAKAAALVSIPPANAATKHVHVGGSSGSFAALRSPVSQRHPVSNAPQVGRVPPLAAFGTTLTDNASNRGVGHKPVLPVFKLPKLKTSVTSGPVVDAASTSLAPITTGSSLPRATSSTELDSSKGIAYVEKVSHYHASGSSIHGQSAASTAPSPLLSTISAVSSSAGATAAPTALAGRPVPGRPVPPPVPAAASVPPAATASATDAAPEKPLGLQPAQSNPQNKPIVSSSKPIGLLAGQHAAFGPGRVGSGFGALVASTAGTVAASGSVRQPGSGAAAAPAMPGFSAALSSGSLGSGWGQRSTALSAGFARHPSTAPAQGQAPPAASQAAASVAPSTSKDRFFDALASPAPTAKAQPRVAAPQVPSTSKGAPTVPAASGTHRPEEAISSTTTTFAVSAAQRPVSDMLSAAALVGEPLSVPAAATSQASQAVTVANTAALDASIVGTRTVLPSDSTAKPRSTARRRKSALMSPIRSVSNPVPMLFAQEADEEMPGPAADAQPDASQPDSMVVDQAPVVTSTAVDAGLPPLVAPAGLLGPSASPCALDSMGPSPPVHASTEDLGEGSVAAAGPRRSSRRRSSVGSGLRGVSSAGDVERSNALSASVVDSVIPSFVPGEQAHEQGGAQVKPAKKGRRKSVGTAAPLLAAARASRSKQSESGPGGALPSNIPYLGDDDESYASSYESFDQSMFEHTAALPTASSAILPANVPAPYGEDQRGAAYRSAPYGEDQDQDGYSYGAGGGGTDGETGMFGVLEYVPTMPSTAPAPGPAPLRLPEASPSQVSFSSLQSLTVPAGSAPAMSPQPPAPPPTTDKTGRSTGKRQRSAQSGSDASVPEESARAVPPFAGTIFPPGFTGNATSSTAVPPLTSQPRQAPAAAPRLQLKPGRPSLLGLEKGARQKRVETAQEEVQRVGRRMTTIVSAVRASGIGAAVVRPALIELVKELQASGTQVGFTFSILLSVIVASCADRELEPLPSVSGSVGVEYAFRLGAVPGQAGGAAIYPENSSFTVLPLHATTSLSRTDTGGSTGSVVVSPQLHQEAVAGVREQIDSLAALLRSCVTAELLMRRSDALSANLRNIHRNQRLNREFAEKQAATAVSQPPAWLASGAGAGPAHFQPGQSSSKFAGRAADKDARAPGSTAFTFTSPMKGSARAVDSSLLGSSSSPLYSQSQSESDEGSNSMSWGLTTATEPAAGPTCFNTAPAGMATPLRFNGTSSAASYDYGDSTPPRPKMKLKTVRFALCDFSVLNARPPGCGNKDLPQPFLHSPAAGENTSPVAPVGGLLSATGLQPMLGPTGARRAATRDITERGCLAFALADVCSAAESLKSMLDAGGWAPTAFDLPAEISLCADTSSTAPASPMVGFALGKNGAPGLVAPLLQLLCLLSSTTRASSWNAAAQSVLEGSRSGDGAGASGGTWSWSPVVSASFTWPAVAAGHAARSQLGRISALSSDAFAPCADSIEIEGCVWADLRGTSRYYSEELSKLGQGHKAAETGAGASRHMSPLQLGTSRGHVSSHGHRAAPTLPFSARLDEALTSAMRYHLKRALNSHVYDEIESSDGSADNPQDQKATDAGLGPELLDDDNQLGSASDMDTDGGEDIDGYNASGSAGAGRPSKRRALQDDKENSAPVPSPSRSSLPLSKVVSMRRIDGVLPGHAHHHATTASQGSLAALQPGDARKKARTSEPEWTAPCAGGVGRAGGGCTSVTGAGVAGAGTGLFLSMQPMKWNSDDLAAITHRALTALHEHKQAVLDLISPHTLSGVHEEQSSMSSSGLHSAAEPALSMSDLDSSMQDTRQASKPVRTIQQLLDCAPVAALSSTTEYTAAHTFLRTLLGHELTVAATQADGDSWKKLRSFARIATEYGCTVVAPLALLESPSALLLQLQEEAPLVDRIHEHAALTLDRHNRGLELEKRKAHKTIKDRNHHGQVSLIAAVSRLAAMEGAAAGGSGMQGAAGGASSGAAGGAGAAAFLGGASTLNASQLNASNGHLSGSNGFPSHRSGESESTEEYGSRSVIAGEVVRPKKKAHTASRVASPDPAQRARDRAAWKALHENESDESFPEIVQPLSLLPSLLQAANGDDAMGDSFTPRGQGAGGAGPGQVEPARPHKEHPHIALSGAQEGCKPGVAVRLDDSLLGSSGGGDGSAGGIGMLGGSGSGSAVSAGAASASSSGSGINTYSGTGAPNYSKLLYLLEHEDLLSSEGRPRYPSLRVCSCTEDGREMLSEGPYVAPTGAQGTTAGAFTSVSSGSITPSRPAPVTVPHARGALADTPFPPVASRAHKGGSSGSDTPSTGMGTPISRYSSDSSINLSFDFDLGTPSSARSAGGGGGSGSAVGPPPTLSYQASVGGLPHGDKKRKRSAFDGLESPATSAAVTTSGVTAAAPAIATTTSSSTAAVLAALGSSGVAGIVVGTGNGGTGMAAGGARRSSGVGLGSEISLAMDLGLGLPETGASSDIGCGTARRRSGVGLAAGTTLLGASAVAGLKAGAGSVSTAQSRPALPVSSPPLTDPFSSAAGEDAELKQSVLGLLASPGARAVGAGAGSRRTSGVGLGFTATAATGTARRTSGVGLGLGLSFAKAADPAPSTTSVSVPSSMTAVQPTQAASGTGSTGASVMSLLASPPPPVKAIRCGQCKQPATGPASSGAAIVRCVRCAVTYHGACVGATQGGVGYKCAACQAKK